MADKKVFRKIGVLTSGGDAPGMNAAVRAITRSAIARGVEVVGIMGGYYGLIHDETRPLGARDVSNIIDRGSTMLWSARCPEFKEEAGMQTAVATCRRLGIDGIVAIGGDGTFRGATDLTVRGIPTIGIPGTIDNDITSTDESIGFDTAMNTAMEAIDKLRDTCESHARCNVVEVMGRDAGYIALQVGIATGAVGIALIEREFDEAAMMEKIRVQRAAGKRSFIVVVAEGVPLTQKADKAWAEKLAARIEEQTGVETKFARLAHMVRGGSPTLRDRLLAARMADCAVDRLLDGESNLVVCSRRGEIVTMDIGYALILDRMYKNKLKPGDLDKFTEAEVASMKAVCEERAAYFRDLYEIANQISC
jgi:6-phosphofructokinase 1